MDIRSFAHNLITWKGFVAASAYPTRITLPSQLWDEVRTLRQYTDHESGAMQQRFPGYTGSLGYEYSATVAYIVDDLYTSKPMGGDWNSVTTQMHIEVKHEPADSAVLQKRFLNQHLVGTKTYTDTTLLANLNFGFVFNMHTHPKHLISETQIGYSFYSATDVNSLLSSSLHLSALITDRLWLLGKTSLSKMPSEQVLRGISLAETAGVDRMIAECKQNLIPLGYVLYTCRFGEELLKL